MSDPHTALHLDFINILEHTMSGAVLRDLCDEALTFQHDECLLGFSLDNPDEPVDDDFETRCKTTVCGRFIPIEQFATEDLYDWQVEAEDEDDDSDDGKTARLRFAQMSKREQDALLLTLRLIVETVCARNCISWVAPEDFLLDAIENDLSFPQFAELMLVRAKDEGHVSFDEMDDSWKYDEPTLVPSQMGGHVKRKLSVLMEENKAEYQEREINQDSTHKYRSSSNASNSRRQTCERRALRSPVKRNSETYFGFAGKGEGFEEYVDWLEHVDMELASGMDDVSVFDIWPSEMDFYADGAYEMEMWSIAFGYARWDGRQYHEMVGADWNVAPFDLQERAWKNDPLRIDTRDSHNDWDWDDGYDDYACDDFTSPPETEGERLVRLYADDDFPEDDFADMGVLAGYGELDADVDAGIPPHSSCVRRTGRYHEPLSRREVELLANGVMAQFTRKPAENRGPRFLRFW